MSARLVFCNLSSVALLLGSSFTSPAAVFHIPNGDVGALKAAIVSANSNAEDDTIELGGGTYVLTAVDHPARGLPNIGPDGGRKLKIRGNGSIIERSTSAGTPSFGVFEISAGASVEISDLTIRNGLDDDVGDAGGIDNDGDVTLNNCVLANNFGVSSGAITNRGNLLINSCVFRSNSAPDGGAITNLGALTISDSTFVDNSAPSDIGGGAIFAQIENATSSMQITNSTFTGNSAPFGGAICVYPRRFATAMTTITNCTFSGNSASKGGAIYNADVGNGDSFARLQMINCTSNANSAASGASIYNDASGGYVRIANSLFNGAGSANFQGQPVTSQGHNVSNDNAAGNFTAAGDQPNTDPKLDPAGLADHGGATQTIALLSDSPAINAADDAVGPGFDQRHYLRSGSRDVGAFEFGGIEFRIDSFARGNQGFSVTFFAVAGETFRLERKLDLINADWSPIAGVSDLMPAASGPAQITDPTATGLSRAFYRIRLLP